MNTIKRIAVGMLFAAACVAQSPGPEQKFFKLEFTLKELDGGKLISSRKYAMSIITFGSNREASSIRSGDKIPVHNSTPMSQFSYVEVGVNIDCNSARETAGGLALNIVSEISSAIPAPEGNTTPQIIRNNKWSAMVVVPLKKPTVVFSSDDPATNHQMQLELLASPLL